MMFSENHFAEGYQKMLRGIHCELAFQYLDQLQDAILNKAKHGWRQAWLATLLTQVMTSQQLLPTLSIVFRTEQDKGSQMHPVSSSTGAQACILWYCKVCVGLLPKAGAMMLLEGLSPCKVSKATGTAFRKFHLLDTLYKGLTLCATSGFAAGGQNNSFCT